MKYSDMQRIEKIYENAAQLKAYIDEHEITKSDIMEDRSLQWLVTTPLYSIGEHVYYMSDDFKAKNPQIQWSMIAGLRHRLVHDYEDTNWEIICDVVYDEVPELVEEIKIIREKGDKEGTSEINKG